jgi:alcohol dehydrogenase class IV
VRAAASADFLWRDVGRIVVFRRRVLDRAPQLLREYGFEDFELLGTERAIEAAPALSEAAEVLHQVPAGQVPQLAAGLLDRLESAKQLVALGGGRVIDTAKAIASVTGARVAAIPTTLSGAEMTAIHRLPAGAEDRVRSLVRPELVIAEPEEMTGLPEEQLRATAMNALAHAVDSLFTPLANPVSRMTARAGAELIAHSLDEEREVRDTAALAQGSILAGYAIDSAGFGMHHVICQSLVRVCGCPHAETNAVILPRSMGFIANRAPGDVGTMAAALDIDPPEMEQRILKLSVRPGGLGDVGADRAKLDEALDTMMLRPELAFTPKPPSRAELEEIVEGAW